MHSNRHKGETMEIHIDDYNKLSKQDIEAILDLLHWKIRLKASYVK